MKKIYLYLIVTIIFLLISLIVFGISILIWPTWLESEQSIVTLISVASSGTIVFLNYFQKIVNNLDSILNQKSDTTSNSIKNEVKVEGSNNAVANIINSPIQGNLTVNTIGSNNDEQLLDFEKILRVPTLPDYFVTRHSQIDQIKNIIILDEPKKTDIAIVGYGGSGKTFLAKSITRLIETDSIIKGRIFWLSIGPNIISKSDLNSFIGDILVSLGVDIEKFKSIETKLLRLDKVLNRGKYILVIDDIWDGIIYSLFRENLDDKNAIII